MFHRSCCNREFVSQNEITTLVRVINTARISESDERLAGLRDKLSVLAGEIDTARAKAAGFEKAYSDAIAQQQQAVMEKWVQLGSGYFRVVRVPTWRCIFKLMGLVQGASGAERFCRPQRTGTTTRAVGGGMAVVARPHIKCIVAS
jgi:hypothetical protein